MLVVVLEILARVDDTGLTPLSWTSWCSDELPFRVTDDSAMVGYTGESLWYTCFAVRLRQQMKHQNFLFLLIWKFATLVIHTGCF